LRRHPGPPPFPYTTLFRSVQLEEVDALPDEQAAEPAHFVRTVRHAAERRARMVGQVQFVRVAEAPGHGDLRAVGEVPGPGNPARVDLVADRDVEPRLGRGGREAARVAALAGRPRVV